MNIGKLTLSGCGAWRRFCMVSLFCAIAGVASHAQSFKTIFGFDHTNGSDPTAPAQGFDGRLYGTTQYGGANDWGTAYRTTISGNLVTTSTFCENCADGGAPGALALGQNGSFYGGTISGGSLGYGTIIRVTGAGAVSTLYDFGQPYGPIFMSSGLVQVPNGNFYATSPYGGTNCVNTAGCGTVFKMTPSGAVTTVYNFCSLPSGLNCLDGSSPASLILGANGNLYGTTADGGAFSGGTVFEITQAGALTTLYSFCSQTNCPDGSDPLALIQGADGSLYGVTYFGGEGSNTIGDSNGTVFKLTPQGALTTLHSFCSQTNCTDGSGPSTLMQASDGNLYGTTYYGGNPKCVPGGCGSIFELTPAGELTTLHNFVSKTDGFIATGLMQHTNGNFYGTTWEGGNTTDGTIFALSTGLGPFVKLVRTMGIVGQSGGILGQGLTGTTSVSINGTPANFTVLSDTYIQATVPAGATSGNVTVDTPSGTLTSNTVFHVIP